MARDSRNAVDDLPDRFADARQLADGAEGGAWVALDEAAGGRRVVLKRVSGRSQRELSRAFAVLRRVASPHLPAVLELVDRGESTWLVTAWIEGTPLKPGPAPVSEVLVEALGVAHALAAIHDVGTHHGDVSANNVLRTSTRGVVLTDLGQLGGLGCGTPGFLAPEVLAGRGGPAADRFALGCLICLRAFGQVPWRAPHALVAVRSRDDVRRRLASLAEATDVDLPQPLVALLERLLAPAADQRISDSSALVDRLKLLHQASLAGAEFQQPPTFWLPARWPYCGPDLGPLAERLSSDSPPRLVLVVGPSGSGRRRVIEELVLSVQERHRGAARLVDAPALAAALSTDATDWLDAWMLGAAEAPVLGVVEPLPWSGELAGTGPRGAAMQAAVLRTALDVASNTLIVMAQPELAEAMRGLGPAVEVLEVARWSRKDIEQVLQPALDGGDLTQWATQLHELTGGWPAQVVRAVEAAASEGLREPDARRLARAASTVLPSLDVAVARRVLEASWGDAHAVVPEHLVSQGAPLRGAVEVARQVLGDQVLDLARAALQDARGDQVPLDLLIDADAGDQLAGRLDMARRSKSELDPRLLAWCEDQVEAQLPAEDAAYLVSESLRTGRAARARSLSQRWPDAPGVRIQGARALQQLGRPGEALALLDDTHAPAVLEPARLGMRFRVLIDLGRAPDAVEEAKQVLPSWTHRHDEPTATAFLWAGMAATQVGDLDLAEDWLERADRFLRGANDRAAASLRARVRQLQANLADARGNVGLAAARYRAARAEFKTAHEPLGDLFVSASLSALAFPTGEIGEGVDVGRAALRGLVARAQVSALPVVAFNLIKCLVRIGALDEAERWRDVVRSLADGSEQTSDIVAARLLRIDADIELSRGRPALEGYVVAARALDAAGLGREAADAWLGASRLARVSGDFSVAAGHLERATDATETPDDLTLGMNVSLEHLALAVAGGDAAGLADAVGRLRTFPGPVDLIERGHLELAWTHDRVLLGALVRERGSGGPAGRLVAQRMLKTLEALMSKVSSLDRAAARAALLSDASDASPLRELVRELGEDVSRLDGEPVEARSPAPNRRAPTGDQAARLAQLIRIYRRLAREDEPERLLEQVVEAMMELTDAERGVVVVRRANDRLEVARELAGEGDAVTFSRSVIDRVLETAAPVISVDAAEDERFDQSRSISHLNLRSVLAVPLMFRGEVLGAAYVDHRLRRGAFDEQDLAFVEDFADLAALAVANARALAEVRRQAGELERQGSELEQLLEKREAEVEGLRQEVRQAAPERRSYRGMVGASEKMQRVFRLVDRLAESGVPVVIYGESGTGKELVARAIHDAGPRAEKPFVAENCGAIPETLLESVLFGHAKGAFTGAQKPKAGLFEAASGGTIFLDEVGEMSAAMQTKLLRVLQEGEVRRVGENGSRKVDVRVIAASNRDLEQMVEEGSFRRDLFYRINVVKFEIPALRARPSDIPALIDHFLERYGDGRLAVTATAMRALTRYPWPGNVRELENEVQRWVALAEDRVRPDDLSPTILGAGDADALDPDDLSLRPRVELLERELIARALERTSGNQTQAAQLLGLSRFGLQKKLRRLNETQEDAST
jgi:transcriptional regulator with GAF, ATPase, and Fis domain